MAAPAGMPYLALPPPIVTVTPPPTPVNRSANAEQVDMVALLLEDRLKVGQDEPVPAHIRIVVTAPEERRPVSVCEVFMLVNRQGK